MNRRILIPGMIIRIIITISGKLIIIQNMNLNNKISCYINIIII